MKVGTRLAVGFTTLFLAMVLVAILSLGTYTKIHERFAALRDDIVPGAIAMVEMATEANRAARKTTDYALVGEDEDKHLAQRALENLEKAGLAHLHHEAHIGLEEQRVAEALVAQIENCASAVRKIMSLKDEGASSVKCLQVETTELHPSLEALLTQLQEHRAVHMKELAEAEEAVCQAHASGTRVILIVTFAIGLLALLAAIYTTRSIVRPVRALNNGAKRIATGDLGYRVSSNARDEIGDLSRAFDRMASELSDSYASLERKVAERTEELTRANETLKAEVAKRKRTQRELEHLTLVLAAIRNVNQLIAREKDTQRLLQGACDNLTASRGYHSAWVAVLDESGKLLRSAEAAVGETFSSMVQRLKGGDIPSCGRKALSAPGVVVVEDPLSSCVDCPLHESHGGSGGITTRLEHGGKIYGLLAVSLARQFAVDRDEQLLVEEIAGDIALALQSIQLEEERKRIEEALQESERRHRTLLDNLPQKIFLKDKNSVYLTCNENYARDLKIKPEEITGKTDYDFYPRELAEKYRADDKRIMESGKTEDIEETYIQNGQKVIVHTVKTSVKDEKGSTIGLLGIFWDITERKRLEREAREVEKLRAIRDLIAGVAHNFNNLLTGVLGYASYVREELEGRNAPLEDIDKLIGAAERVTKLTQQLRMSAAPSYSPRVSVTLDVVVGRLAEHCRKLLPRNVELATEVAAPDTSLHISLESLLSALDSTLNNAVEAMKAGGMLSITADKVRRKSDKGESTFAMIAITDTGEGVPADILPKIFDPFFSTKGTVGVGLGLTVVRRIIEDMGGTVEVQSTPGEGTTCQVFLPIMQG